ncbi:MAG: hypothetical protein AB7T38_02555 [Nitrospirales bacterium]
MTRPTIWRLIQEFFCRRMICQWTGEHDFREKRIRIIKDSKSWSWVAEEYWAYFYECWNCDHRQPFHKEEFIQGIHSLTLPRNQMDVFREKGWIEYV